jgi:hypothetical protein
LNAVNSRAPFTGPARAFYHQSIFMWAKGRES